MVLDGTSIAVLTYIGFDGISTLSEEVHNPRRNILLATVLICLVTGVLAVLQVYAAQLVWRLVRGLPGRGHRLRPRRRQGRRARGSSRSSTWRCSSPTSAPGSGSQLGAGRLLYGMGRDNAHPAASSAPSNPRRDPAQQRHPRGAIALVGAFTLTYQLGAEMLNFGAFIAFMGVNLAALHPLLPSRPRPGRSIFDGLLPLLGFVICGYLWLSLRWPARLAGGAWLLVGVAYGAWKTQGFEEEADRVRGGRTGD